MEGISDRLSGDKGQQSLRDEIQEASMGSVPSQLAEVACGERVPHMGWNQATYRAGTEGLERPRQLKCVRRARGNMSVKGALENCRTSKGQLSNQLKKLLEVV